jgi:hypothetical protein
LYPGETASIVGLAERLHRSQSDAIRYVLLDALLRLSQEEPAPGVLNLKKMKEIKVRAHDTN